MKRKNQPHWVIAEIAEQEAPGNTINLWPRIQARATSQTNKARKPIIGGQKKQLVYGLMVIMVLVGSLACVPSVRAFAEDFFQRMGLAFVDTEQYDQTITQSPAEVIRVTPSPSLTLAEVRAQIPFKLLVPTWMPDGLDFIHRDVSQYDPAELAGSGKHVNINYGRSVDFDWQQGVLSFRANDGPIGAPYVLAASREQSVTVNGVPGIYVHGGWQSDGSGDPNTRMGDLLWDDNADDAYLTWTQDGVTYLLAAHNLGLNLDDLLRIASSMSEK